MILLSTPKKTKIPPFSPAHKIPIRQRRIQPNNQLSIINNQLNAASSSIPIYFYTPSRRITVRFESVLPAPTACPRLKRLNPLPAPDHIISIRLRWNFLARNFLQVQGLANGQPEAYKCTSRIGRKAYNAVIVKKNRQKLDISQRLWYNIDDNMEITNYISARYPIITPNCHNTEQ